MVSTQSTKIPLHTTRTPPASAAPPQPTETLQPRAVAPADAYGVATFYAMFATTPRPPTVAHVCDDIACRIAGAERICEDLTRALGPAGQPARDGQVGWLRSPCLGLCDVAPAA